MSVYPTFKGRSFSIFVRIAISLLSLLVLMSGVTFKRDFYYVMHEWHVPWVVLVVGLWNCWRYIKVMGFDFIASASVLLFGMAALFGFLM